MPYQSACNGAVRFAHFGWENTRALPTDSLTFRQRVPFWTTGADSLVLAVLDSFPGSERVVSLNRQTGRPSGTGPRMFGLQTSIALGRDRLYIGTGERPEVIAVHLGDLTVDTIALPLARLPLDATDVAAEKAVRLAVSRSALHESVEREFAAHPFPDSLPPYAALMVDADDKLWIQDYPRASSSSVRWTVVSDDGALVAWVALPSHLQVFEIGPDYVLGRYLDPVEAIPQVHLYRLRRN
jgi:hypothetical protein